MTPFEEAQKRALTFAPKDRVDDYADADQVCAVADTQAGADYHAATDAADSGHREQTADDRGEYEVAMFGRHAGQMSVALNEVLALPAPSPIQELLLTYRSGTAVHDMSLAGAVRAARNDYQTLLTPAYAAATAADGLADVAFTSSASGADRTYNVSMSDVGRQWWVGFDGAVIARQVAAQKADAARARSQAAAEAAYTTQRAWAGADLQQRYADAYVQWTDAVSAAQDVLQQPGVGPADGQYLGYLTSMAHQARETEIRLAQEAYVAAIAGGQTTRADDLGTAEDVLATGLNAAGSAYTSAVNSAESGFTGGAGAAGVSHVQGLVNADAVYANSLAEVSGTVS